MIVPTSGGWRGRGGGERRGWLMRRTELLEIRMRVVPTFGQTPELLGRKDAGSGNGVVTDNIVERVAGVTCKIKHQRGLTINIVDLIDLEPNIDLYLDQSNF